MLVGANRSPRRTAVAAGFPFGRADASPRPVVAPRSPGAKATAVAIRRAFRGGPSTFEEARRTASPPRAPQEGLREAELANHGRGASVGADKGMPGSAALPLLD